MSGRFQFAAAVLSLALATLAVALGYVEYRSRHPEWRDFQSKGTALALERLQAQLSHATGQEKDAIRTEIETLRKRPLEIVEIRPFAGKMPVERCLTCHYGIEDVSQSHPNSVFGCVICHGGNGSDLTVKGAHLGLRGGRNPASLDLATASCGSIKAGAGKCHSDREHHFLNRVDNVPGSIMATNAGIVGILRFQWGIERDSASKYAVRAVTDGRISLEPVPPETTVYARPLMGPFGIGL